MPRCNRHRQGRYAAAVRSSPSPAAGSAIFAPRTALFPRAILPIAIAAGAVSATGFAPLGWWPAALIGFGLFALLVVTAPGARSAWARGWAFGMGQFTLGLNWIAHAFTYQDAMPHWFGYPAVALLSVYLAVFPGLAALAAWPARRHPVALGLALGAGWIATEWLRAHLFTGFAWNPVAAIWADTPGLHAALPWIGTHGLGGITVAAAAFGGAAFGKARGRSVRLLPALPVLVLAALALLPLPPAPVVRGPAVRIIQPNIDQAAKHDEAAQIDHFRTLARLTGTPGPAPRLIFWPEAAIDNGYYLAEDQGLRDWLARRLGPRDLLLTGGVALEYGADGRAVGGRNSVFVLGADARIRGRYDKAHLVPYGEYLPMRGLLEPLGLSRLVPGDLDFWPGPGPASLDLPGFGRAGFQICYEIIFPGAVASRAARPDFLFNPSNDAWFGRWGPPQHLAQARLRAAEEGLPVIRATPTGISALIGPSGEVIARLPHRAMGAIDGHLPRPLPPTAFARLGNLLSLMVALALGGLAIVSARRAR